MLASTSKGLLLIKAWIKKKKKESRTNVLSQRFLRKLNHCYCSTAYDIMIKTRENNSHSRSYSHLPRESMRGIENKWEVRLFLRPPNFMVPVLRLQEILAYYFNTLADLKKIDFVVGLMCVDVRVCCLLSLSGFWGLNSGDQVWWQAPSPSEPSCWP